MHVFTQFIYYAHAALITHHLARVCLCTCFRFWAKGLPSAHSHPTRNPDRHAQVLVVLNNTCYQSATLRSRERCSEDPCGNTNNKEECEVQLVTCLLNTMVHDITRSMHLCCTWQCHIKRANPGWISIYAVGQMCSPFHTHHILIREIEVNLQALCLKLNWFERMFAADLRHVKETDPSSFKFSFIQLLCNQKNFCEVITVAPFVYHQFKGTWVVCCQFNEQMPY